MDPHIAVRVNYFGGEYLVTEDFNRDQRYHKYAREDFNGGVFIQGVISGLKLQLDASKDPLKIYYERHGDGCVGAIDCAG